MAFGSSDKGNSGKGRGDSSSLIAGIPKNGQAAFLGAGSKVVGKLVFSGPAVLSGQVEGEVKADARLEVGESAVIKAKVEGSDILVKGTIEGDVIATSKLELFRSGKIIGNVSCASIYIEDGAVFEGSCKMINRSPRTVSPTAVNPAVNPAGNPDSVSSGKNST